MITRRGFVKLLATVPIALHVTPLIGSVAGGLHVPAPEDIAKYVKFSGVKHFYDPPVMHAEMYVAWAPPGATTAMLQCYAGTMLVTGDDRLLEVKKQNMLESFRSIWNEDHYPGWLRVWEATGYDEEKDVRTSEQVWRRVGYIKWLTPEEVGNLRSYRVEIAA